MFKEAYPDSLRFPFQQNKQRILCTLAKTIRLDERLQHLLAHSNAIQTRPDKSKAENRPSKEMMGMADFAEKHRHHGEDHGFDRSISSVFVWDNVFGPALLRALQQCADDFAIWRAKSPQRLLGFWLPSDSTPRTVSSQGCCS